MDVLLVIADFVQLMSITALLLKILYTRKCNDISAKTQFLLALVYTTKYLHVFTACMPAYSFITKGLSILITYSTFMTICGCYRKSYESKHDTYRIETLLAPCLVFAVFFNHEFSLIGISWAFSEYLEAVAMVPQFVLLANARRAHKFVLCYITAQTVYKCLHIVYWICQYYQQNSLDKISASSSIIQSLLYLDFFVNIWLHLEPVRDESIRSPLHETIEVDFPRLKEQLTEVKGENLCEKNGYLSLNMNIVGLDPSSLRSNDNDKDLLKIKEELL